MSKRLQVVFGDDELRALSRAARRTGLTLSEWVRQTLRRAQRESDARDSRTKLDALRRSLEYDFPAGEIEQMLAEIERGYTQDDA